jgi:hypothetical protein
MKKSDFTEADSQILKQIEEGQGVDFIVVDDPVPSPSRHMTEDDWKRLGAWWGEES